MNKDFNENPIIDRKTKLSEYYQIGRIISIIYRAGQSFFVHNVKDLDIGGGHMALIFHLYKHDGASQDELAKALEVDKATVTRAIHKLEEQGVVERRRDPIDQRINRIVLTESGHAHQSQLREIANEWHETLLFDFSEEEVDQLKYLLDKLTKNAVTYKNTLLKK